MERNIYCDESCHLQNDGIDIMAFGAIQCPKDHAREVSLIIKNIKDKHNCHGELKWVKVSPSRIDFYFELLDYFFDDDNLNFRQIMYVGDKKDLDHDTYNNGSHDEFYYKMYYGLLKNIIENNSNDCHSVFIDIKDTKSSEKVSKLKVVLQNKFHDYYNMHVKTIQQIRSHESNLLQVCDFLLGAVTYSNRELSTSAAKSAVVEYLSKKVKYNINRTTPPWECKFNVFRWNPGRTGRA